MKKNYSLILLWISLSAASQSAVFTKKILPPDALDTGVFGVSIAQSNTIICVGDTSDNDGSVALTGAVYILEKQNNDFSSVQKLKAPFLESGDAYGFDISIHGDFIAVGAGRYEFNNSATGLPRISDAGAVFLYKRNASTSQWDLVNTLFAPTRFQNNQFGWKVILTDTELIVTEGQYRYSTPFATRAGRVYVYNYDNAGNITLHQTIDNPEPTTDDFFGEDLALSGNTLAIGARGEKLDSQGANSLNSAGAVYLFNKNNSGMYVQQQKVVADPRVGGANFGAGIAIDGDVLAVGAINETRMPEGTTNIFDCGIAYIFKNISGTWTQTAVIEPSEIEQNASFGRSIALAGDNVFIGYEGGRVPFNGSSRANGSVNRYQLNPNGSVSNFTLIAPPYPDTTGNFGYNISLDDSHLVVGAFSDRGDVDGALLSDGTLSPGAIYIYDVTSTLSIETSVFEGLKLYPNPAREAFRLSGFSADGVLTLYTSTGKKIKQMPYSSGDMVDISRLSVGLYHVNFQSQNSIYTTKLIKLR